MFTHIHISWSPSAARSHFKVLMLYLEYQLMMLYLEYQLLMFHSDIYTDLNQNIMPQYIQGTFHHHHHYSCHDYLCQSHSRVWSSILPQLHQTNQTLPVSLASSDHDQYCMKMMIIMMVMIMLKIVMKVIVMAMAINVEVMIA